MPTDYNYDDQGQFFPYFVLTLAALVTFPTTYSFLKPSKDLENTASRVQSDFRPEHADLIDGQRKKQRRRERKTKRMLFAIGGWLLMAWMVYLMAVTARTVTKIWDPYEVLGVSRTATEKQIKSHYRKLSLVKHPDKVQVDPSRNDSAQVINDEWVDITKAFKALTDEEIRNNYLQYGHPDGKQSFSIGIALPKFIITEGNGKYVLLVYGALLGIILPYFVGKWWYGTQRITKERVLVASAGKIFREYEDANTEGGVLGVLSSGAEFKETLVGQKAKYALQKLEKKVLAEGSPAIPGMTQKDRAKIRNLDDVTRRKALALLWAYLGRIELDDGSLNDEKFEIAPIAHHLNQSFIAISLAYGNTIPLLCAYRTSQCLVQAVPPKGAGLMQLPYFNAKVIHALEGEEARAHMRIQDFLQIPADQRRTRVLASGAVTDDQYKAAMKVASQIPNLSVEKAFFKVMGERVITPSSLVNFVVKARFIPLGSNDIPPVAEADLEEVDPPEGDLDVLQGRKRLVRTKDGKRAFQKATEEKIQPLLAHAPYFARDVAPKWHVFLADSKQGKIAVPPFTFSTFDKPIIDASGKPTFNMQTLKMQFQAPPQVGRYTFVMHLVCDSYVDMDTKLDVTLVVEDMSKADEIKADEEISEPEGDTIAGQMSALKSGGLASGTKGKQRLGTADSSDDSDTEGDVDSESETDTDTDTDED